VSTDISVDTTHG